jgi:MFS family permease
LSNVVVLALANMLAASGLTVLVILGGIIGPDLAPRPSLATLPLSAAVVSTALTTILASSVMYRFGRRTGFILGVSVGAMGSMVAAWSLVDHSFELFTVGACLMGGSVAFSQQYRFAAAESVPSELVSRAVSIVLIGALGAALVGPQLALAARSWIPSHEYVGSFLTVSVLYVLAGLMLTRFKPVLYSGGVRGSPADAPRDRFAQPSFFIAVLVGACGFAVMSFLMTATPISMHRFDHHSVEATTFVIQSHVIAMFLPSLVSGHVLAKFGERHTILLATILLTGCAAVSVSGHGVMHYWWGLVLLGVGWNFLFLTGTTLLAKSVSNRNRFRGQAINEFTVFGTQACASLLAGLAVQQTGWVAMNLLTLPLLAAVLLAAFKLPKGVMKIASPRLPPLDIAQRVPGERFD